MLSAFRSLLLVIACYVHDCSALTLLPASMPRAPVAAARAAAPTMLFGGGGKEGEGGGMNMMETIKKAQEVGVKVKELQEELQGTEIEAVAGESGVTVVISGAQVPISVSVTPDLLAQGSEAVSAAVSLAAKEAHTNSVRDTLERLLTLSSDRFTPPAPRLCLRSSRRPPYAGRRWSMQSNACRTSTATSACPCPLSSKCCICCVGRVRS